ncbi:ATP-dependent helicase HrpB [Acidiphilium sp. AL]|uniref:ATP-dependent helicase HrpB n=1 Tax=Acidiphilium iwatense TaxID=768198 RepID=A0ABS9E0E7_9PROT|nr:MULTISPECIES: ATP-dependent helicase HrpB [Acidiphilium]MCF3948466.1 ATP-dependent helicase HrpB [Acidiphilium iwatense]MCU4158533.1 ATP-dependent helicase HrpB [Acidiphilium sp. AL]
MDALPVAEMLPALNRALAAKPNAVLIAPPGAGKTTLVPQALLAADWVRGGRIIMLEPRRLAARAAAERIASLIGEAPGGLIGYRTRLEQAVGPRTRVEIITEGLLTRRLLSDPGLDGVTCVIFDEIHERSLEADLALALTLDLQRGLRPELRLLAMSATADGARLADLLDATVIESAGRAHKVAVEHAARDIADPRDLPEALARAVRAALAAHRGDILAFLPGVGEIRRAEVALAGVAAEVVALFGDLPPAEQARVLAPSAARRVILATSIAETSLTVPGVRVVVDGGFRRAPQFDAGWALTRLVTRRISKAAATQRAGRAGREAPGVAIRLWTEALHRGLPEFDRPEIIDAELSSLVLSCAAWGERSEDLRFADPPPPGALASARALLRSLGALDGDGRMTGRGRRMAELGTAPRLAAMMLAAEAAPEQALAADLAALLEERDPLRDAGTAEISLRLEAIAGRNGGDRGTIARIRQAAAQYRARLGLRRDAPAHGDAALLIAAGFPDRIASRRGEPGSFRLAEGGGAKLDLADPLAKAPMLAVASLGGRGAPKIGLAAVLDPESLTTRLADRIVTTRDVALDGASGTVLLRERRRLGSLVLADRSFPASPDEIASALRDAVIAKPERLGWSEPVRQLQARVGWMRSIEPEDWPDFSDAALHATLDDWFVPYLAGLSRLKQAEALDLAAILRDALGHERSRRLDSAVPEHIAAPGGRVAIDYTAPAPVASARAQAFYGLDETPGLAGGKLALRIALLSPAGRPIAVTGDLAGFWRGGWADARRDMRGRYPKHDWPEEPWRAPARPARPRR